MNKTKKSIVLTIFAGILALAFILPMFLTVTNSFMSENEIENNYGSIMSGIEESKESRTYAGLRFIPDRVTIKQYYRVLVKQSNYLLMFWNSVIMVAPILGGQLLVASMAAYAFSMLDFKFREQLFLIYIITMLMPFQVTLVPNYIIMDLLGILGTFRSIIFPGVFGTFGVFLLRQFMVAIPKEILESAMVDGAGHFTVFFRMVLPMSRNAVAALLILVLMDNWNMVEQPLIFLTDPVKQPLSLFLSRVNLEEMGVAFAASVVYMIPMLLLFLYAEDYFIEGIQHSGIK